MLRLGRLDSISIYFNDCNIRIKTERERGRENGSKRNTSVQSFETGLEMHRNFPLRSCGFGSKLPLCLVVEFSRA